MAKFLIIDEMELVRNSLKSILQNNFINSIFLLASNKDEIEILTKEVHTFDLIIMDLELTTGSGYKVVRNLLDNNKNQKILIFTRLSEQYIGTQIFQIGCLGYLNKRAEISDIIDAVQTVLEGRKYVSNRLKNIILEASLMHSEGRRAPLFFSKKELEVASLLSQGMGNLDICNKLNLHPSTVTSYRKKIFGKLNVENVIQLNHKMYLRQAN